MWKKVLAALFLLIIILFALLRIGAPYYADYKLHAFLKHADTASYSQLNVDIWDGSVELRNVYLIDTSASISQNPVRLQLSRLAVKNINFWTFFTSQILQCDSVVIRQGSIELPLIKTKDSYKEKKKRKSLIAGILINNLTIDSVAVNFLLGADSLDERFNALVVCRASDISIPISNKQAVAWNGNLNIYDLLLNDAGGRFGEKNMNLALKSIAIKGVRVEQFEKHKGAHIDSLVIGKGQIAFELAGKDSSAVSSSTNSTNVLQGISLGYFNIDSVALNIDLNPQKTNERFAATFISEAQNVSLPFVADAPLAYQNLRLSISDLYLQPRKSIAYFELEKLDYLAEENTLRLENISMRQRIRESYYAQYFGFDKTYTRVDLYRATIYGIPHDLQKITDGIHVQKIAVQGVHTYLYKDRRLPHPKTPKPFPLEVLSQSKIPIRIDTLKLIDGQLFYNENWREDHVPGLITLSNVAATFTNINSAGPTENGDWTLIKANIVLQNKLELAVDWRFDLRKNCKAFTLDLGIGEAPFKVMNSFTENAMGVHFKSGKMKGGRLLVKADKKSGSGTLDLYYEKMKLDIIDKQSHDKHILGWAAGGLTNLVVRNNNVANQNPRQGIVYAEPVPDRAIYSYVLRLFFSGFKDLALGSNNQKKIEQNNRQTK